MQEVYVGVVWAIKGSVSKPWSVTTFNGLLNFNYALMKYYTHVSQLRATSPISIRAYRVYGSTPYGNIVVTYTDGISMIFITCIRLGERFWQCCAVKYT